MTLPEKSGQLFTVAVFGDSATAPSAADTAANQAVYGVDAHNGAAVVAKYRVGGIICFTITHNLNDPQQIAALSNGLQQAALSNGDVAKAARRSGARRTQRSPSVRATDS